MVVFCQNVNAYSLNKDLITVTQMSLPGEGYATSAFNSGVLDIERYAKLRVLLIDASLTFQIATATTKICTFPDSVKPRTTHQAVTMPHGILDTTITVIVKNDGLYMAPNKTGTFNVRCTIPYFIT